MQILIENQCITCKGHTHQSVAMYGSFVKELCLLEQLLMMHRFRLIFSRKSVISQLVIGHKLVSQSFGHLKSRIKIITESTVYTQLLLAHTLGHIRTLQYHIRCNSTTA